MGSMKSLAEELSRVVEGSESESRHGRRTEAGGSRADRIEEARELTRQLDREIQDMWNYQKDGSGRSEKAAAQALALAGELVEVLKRVAEKA